MCKLCQAKPVARYVADIPMCRDCGAAAEIRIKQDRKAAGVDRKKWVD